MCMSICMLFYNVVKLLRSTHNVYVLVEKQFFCFVACCNMLYAHLIDGLSIVFTKSCQHLVSYCSVKISIKKSPEVEMPYILQQTMVRQM